MSDEVSYKISFPDIEMNGIHAKEAIQKAAEYFKNNTLEVKWVETHTEECHCNTCEDERQ